MGIRCRIGIEYKDGSIDTIYCHSSSMLAYTGEILSIGYRGKKKAMELIGQGGIRQLGYVRNFKEHDNLVEKFTKAVYNAGIDFGKIDFSVKMTVPMPGYGIEHWNDLEEFYASEHWKKWCDCFYLFRIKKGKWYYIESYYENVNGEACFLPKEPVLLERALENM